ncbi:MAG: hypothetical protein JRN37_04085 [Nitrososphaerota archaeon]|jgi:hypothetical protein|nr:hypothetical protein [Nitrososphaerota archaeon]
MYMHKDEKFKVEIPRSLHQAIIRIQAGEDADWGQACDRVALLVDPRREEFGRAVKSGAERLAKSRFMKDLNAARKSIADNAFKRGQDWVRQNEDHFRVPCSVCGKPMHFSSNDENWEEKEKPILEEAFANWLHTSCEE